MFNDDNCVIFKGRKDGILVLLDDKADFVLLKDTLRKKVVAARKFFAGAKASITFKGRVLTEDEEYQLLDIIFRETNLHITFVHVEAANRAGGGFPPTEIGVPDRFSVGKPDIPDLIGAASDTNRECMTFYHQGSLRSGQFIRFPGSVVVLGDVNPGGEIIAEGSVIVLGALKGMVHAGCAGDTHSFVSAVKLSPTQLRIADIITYVPVNKTDGESQPSRKQRGSGMSRFLGGKKTDAQQNTYADQEIPPSYAYIHEGQIYIAPLVNL